MDNIFGKHASSIIHHPKLQITFVHIIGISQNICEKHLFYYACSVVKKINKRAATVEDRLFSPYIIEYIWSPEHVILRNMYSVKVFILQFMHVFLPFEVTQLNWTILVHIKILLIP